MKSEIYLINNQRHRVKAKVIGHELWLHVDGETHIYDLRPKPKAKPGSSRSASGGDILAPMPGKILKIKHKVGDSVEVGATLIVMEAMKMEYSLAASVAGKIRELKCKEGQQVELGETLALVEPTGDKK